MELMGDFGFVFKLPKLSFIPLMLPMIIGKILEDNMDIIPYANFTLNFRIFIYAILITLFFGLFSGVYPAWRMSRLKPVYALQGGQR